jgi:hypothetical protein
VVVVAAVPPSTVWLNAGALLAENEEEPGMYAAVMESTPDPNALVL